MLVSPENFGVVEPGVYRCSKIEVENFQFLETLTLKSIVVLDAEKPPRSISNFLETNKIELYNLGDLKISNHQHTGILSKTDIEDYDEVESTTSVASNADKDGSFTATATAASTNTSNTANTSRSSSQQMDTTMPAIMPIAALSRKSRDQWMLIEKNLIVKSFELIFNSRRHPLLIVDSTATLVGILRKIQKWNFNLILNEYRIFNSTSNKNNYFAETFLELISIELIPYENRKRSPFGSRRNSSNIGSRAKSISSALEKLAHLQKSPQIYSTDLGVEKIRELSISKQRKGDISGIKGYNTEDIAIDDDEEEREYDKEENEQEEDDSEEYDSMDDMDDMDDELLSASPQIPENLLKFVEQRRQDKQAQLSSNGRNSIDNDSENEYGTSPRMVRIPNTGSCGTSTSGIVSTGSHGSASVVGSTSRTNSFSNSQDYLNVVRGMDRRRSSVDTMKNIKFRNNDNLLHAGSIESSTSPQLKRKESRSGSHPFNEIVTKPVEYKYYKNLHKYPKKFENVGTIKLKLPAEHRLPNWFTKSRDIWEKNYRLMNEAGGL